MSNVMLQDMWGGANNLTTTFASMRKRHRLQSSLPLSRTEVRKALGTILRPSAGLKRMSQVGDVSKTKSEDQRSKTEDLRHL